MYTLVSQSLKLKSKFYFYKKEKATYSKFAY